MRHYPHCEHNVPYSDRFIDCEVISLKETLEWTKLRVRQTEKKLRDLCVKQPPPNELWCYGCNPENCPGCGLYDDNE